MSQKFSIHLIDDRVPQDVISMQVHDVLLGAYLILSVMMICPLRCSPSLNDAVFTIVCLCTAYLYYT